VSEELKCKACGGPITAVTLNCKACGASTLKLKNPGKGSKIEYLKTGCLGLLVVCGMLFATVLLVAVIAPPKRPAIASAEKTGAVSHTPTEANPSDRPGLDEDHRLGLHCVVGGFNDDFVNKVKERLRDPNSFEHIETRINPIDSTGHHIIGMRFRSRNGFGGMNEQTAIGRVNNSTCSATVTTIG